MKRTFSINASQLLATALGLTLAWTSCQKVDVPPNGQALIEKAAGNRPNTVPQVNLILTVSDNIGNKIESDAKGDYIHGVDGVSAYFDQSGNLQFSTNSNMTRRSGPAARTMNYYFDDPLSGSQSATPVTNPNGNYRLVTGLLAQTPIPIQSLPVGGSETNIALHGGFVSQIASTTDWGCNFRYGLDQDDATENFVTVTRLDDTHWVMTGDVTNPVGALKTDHTLTGYYHMPFSFTFTKQ